MKASVRSVRIAPKKANLIAKMVRGMPVPVAVEALRRTHKKAARIIEVLLRSAIANASHNLKQDPQTMVIREIIVNQGQALHRGVPMARGRTRPIRKFLSHIRIELGYAEDPTEKMKKKQKNQRNQKSKQNGEKEGSKAPSSAVQHTGKKPSTKTHSSVSSASSVSSSSS